MNFERTFIEKATFFLVMFLVYFSPIFRYQLGVVFLFVPLFLLALCLSSIIFHIGINHIELRVSDVVFTFVLISFLYIAIVFGTTTDTLIILIVPILTLFARLISFDNLKAIFRIFVVIQATLMLYEVITQSYLYVIQVGDIILDEKMMGGSIGIFRAKGLFESPTVASIFLITSALFIGSDKKWFFCLLVLSLMTGGRTPVIIIGMIGAYLHLKNMIYGANIFEKILMVVFLSICVVWLSQLDLLVFDRLSETTDLSASSNTARLKFWVSAIDFYSHYELSHLLFGNMGSYRLEFDNSTESGWLQILVDLGLSGLLLFLLPLLRVLWSNLNFDTLFFVFIIIICNFVFTFSFGIIGAFSYWLIVFRFDDICKTNSLIK
ncbi:hypothetical protein [Vibrio breoganii]|uniref:hypothetical protein n=1 Tax=Vibrio breoganii TaxID=553239 RepID=UPI000C841D41|nr:hypothetical protein [Vibrio breoganii]PMM19797.1 hypothetical protein BCT59_08360 [Vibrio breoganii]